jgi:hypothetical protein
MRPAWQERDAEEERRNFEHRCRAEVYAAGEEIYQLEQRLAVFEALAKRAATFAVGIAPDNLGTAVRAILDELAAMHPDH